MENVKQVSTLASPSVAWERWYRESLVARESEEATSSSHVTHSQSSTYAQLFCVLRKDFRGKERLLAVYRNSSQITGELIATVTTEYSVSCWGQASSIGNAHEVSHLLNLITPGPLYTFAPLPADIINQQGNSTDKKWVTAHLHIICWSPTSSLLSIVIKS